MSQIDPLVFGAVVIALVGISIFAPKFFARDTGPTADDVYLDSLPSVYDKRITVRVSEPIAMAVTVPEQPQSTPPGAPRAASPTRQPVASSAPPTRQLAPLKLPE
ncbi:MAG: hypothetical protein JHD02_08550 [Thermoleophilaceae bacterium]|nr:hypothetical protein [Thermoleophilaceae bacterium]